MRIQTTTEITHGSSGGPLFNMKGEVIGITTSGIGEANLNFAMNIQKLSIKL
jgi:serine protease Do